uniref:ATP synthase complex subunit 8 n=1 Tax=Pseudoniphargus sp. 6-Morocco A TaxID=2291047 RepID=A0A345UEA9_9CRUS|nr:ATP synthase F0 subunit 8 [Pseudoniphargus sp. 6-Morocco A]
MPQMAPIMWLPLFLFFLLLIYLLTSYLFFISPINSTDQMTLYSTQSQLNWKW